MKTLDIQETQLVGGGQPSLGNVLAVGAAGIAICTAPAWGAVAGLVTLAVIMARTME